MWKWKYRVSKRAQILYDYLFLTSFTYSEECNLVRGKRSFSEEASRSRCKEEIQSPIYSREKFLDVSNARRFVENFCNFRESSMMSKIIKKKKTISRLSKAEASRFHIRPRERSCWWKFKFFIVARCSYALHRVYCHTPFLTHLYLSTSVTENPSESFKTLSVTQLSCHVSQKFVFIAIFIRSRRKLFFSRPASEIFAREPALTRFTRHNLVATIYLEQPAIPTGDYALYIFSFRRARLLVQGKQRTSS